MKYEIEWVMIFFMQIYLQFIDMFTSTLIYYTSY